MLPIIGLIAGMVLGLLFIPADISYEHSTYVAVAILAALDSVFGGIAARVQNKFNMNVFISGFFGNAILAAILAYLGDLLGIQLYLAAIFAFGNRLFLNFAIIRLFWLSKLKKGEPLKVDPKDIPEGRPILSGRINATDIFGSIDVQEDDDVQPKSEK